MSRRLTRASALLAVFVATSGWAAQQKACTLDAMIVFDGSGSMAASDFPEGLPSRIDRVRHALTSFLPRVSKTRNLGLLIYGPGKHSDACQNVDLRFKPMPDAGGRIISQVERLIPDGRTPLTEAVRQAVNVFGAKTSGAVVLLTDGEETCGGDPCALAQEIHRSEHGIAVHIIGYKLQSLDGRPPVSGAKCLADTTGGTYATAETIDELISALTNALGCPTLAQHDATALKRLR